MPKHCVYFLWRFFYSRINLVPMLMKRLVRVCRMFLYLIIPSFSSPSLPSHLCGSCIPLCAYASTRISAVLSIDIVCRHTRWNRSVLSNCGSSLRRVMPAVRVSVVLRLHLTTMPTASRAGSENEVIGDKVSTPLENRMTLGLHSA